ncbi:Endoglucanase E-4 [Pseudolycoriella hygida]|uniref:Endoglucanase n=1 Tax=Pseudolycoriella hygida TaxID=35572 RepID=A0A9Q0S416_9DIPT|nr:Endoglucanase E-4 [Pseudolycoriella hygida]
MKFLICFQFISLLICASAGDYDYAEVLEKSLLFYEAQRTGYLPDNNRIPWRGDSFVTDQGDEGEDLEGGYFDAGDHVKFQFPAAAAMTYLAWGMYDSVEGYQKAGQWENALSCLRWGMDYFIKIHPSPNVLYVQIGNGTEDHRFWGRPEDWNGSDPRPTLKATPSKPASDVAGETSASMSAASMVFRFNGNTEYADLLLMHATQLYNFAVTYQGLYSDSFPEVRNFYNSRAYGDELLWSAAWLYRATGDLNYRQDYIKWWTEFELNYRPTSADWSSKVAQAQVLLAKIDGSAQFVNATREFCDWFIKDAPKTPKNLVFISLWGSLRHNSNIVYLCLQAANIGINTDVYRAFAKSQIDYMLGDTGRSFVVGFGNNPPVRPHHRAASCPDPPAICDDTYLSSPDPSPQILIGALVGGPNITDEYVDDREDYVQNEVTLDYNAGYQSSIAELCKLYCSGTGFVRPIYFMYLILIVVSLLK